MVSRTTSSAPIDISGSRCQPIEMSFAEVVDELGQEVALAVGSDGTIVWVDRRAEAAGLVTGESFAARVVPGCEDKARELLLRGSVSRILGWELPVVLGERPETFLWSAAQTPNGLVLVGSRVAQSYADVAAAGQGAIHEIVELNRQLARQKSQLEESNQGIRALHAELTQQADRLRSSNEIKSRLVAGVSHEFRTPLHSIMGLSRVLLDEVDGPLVGEQRTQVEFIRTSAEELATMINDMLDLARIDSGSAPLRPTAFDVAGLLSALRGTMVPLIPAGKPIELIIDPAPDVTLETDQAKVAQILRNLVANAIKFTERGTVRITATLEDDVIAISVRDTGIGIAKADQVRVFEEFTQIDSALQRAAKGTGLGLPLSRKLAQLLAGDLTLVSEPGRGSTFTLRIPLEHPDVAQYKHLERTSQSADPERTQVLVVEDDRSQVFVYEQYLAMAGFGVIPARTTQQARALLAKTRPSAILLDVMLEGEDTWNFLTDLKASPETRDIPVLVCTVMNRESQARALGADEFWLKPIDGDKLIKKLQGIAQPGSGTVLVIDDDPQMRYLVKKLLAGTRFEVIEAADGPTGVALARERKPDVLLLDFLLEEGTAFDVLDQLKAHPATRRIPVIVVTSHALPTAERERLARQTESILSKEHLSRELAINRIRDALQAAGIKNREAAR